MARTKRLCELHHVPNPCAFCDEQDYADLADELNDGSPGQLTIEDFDPRSVAGGARHAAAHGLSWPPQTGDFDRYWERQHSGRRTS